MKDGIHTPLTGTEIELLLSKSHGKIKLLLALGIGTGISMEEACQIRFSDILCRMNLSGRLIAVPKRVVDMAKYVHRQGEDQFMADSIEYMNKVVLRETFSVLGYERSYKALRRTFIILCASKGISFDEIVRNTGTNPDTVYPIYASVLDHVRSGIPDLL